MNMKPASRPALLLAAIGLLAAPLAARAQPDNQPSSPSPAATEPAPAPASAGAATTGDAREALKKQAGDVDQSTLLKDTLTKADRQYSLLKAGRIAANYDLNYSYVGQEAIDVGFDTNSNIDLFKVETTRAHTVTNSFSVDYGLMDNLTLTGALPFVSKFTQSDSFSGVANAIGDMTLGARYQPFAQKASGPTVTFTSQVSLATGRSPFKMRIGDNLSTGAGYSSLTLGVNASQVMDPVALFGSLSFTDGLSVRNLHQTNPSDGSILTAVHPGKSIGFGAGFTYALSYNISTSTSVQETVTTASHIDYLTSANVAKSRDTQMQVAAMLNFGLGVRLNPKTTVNLSAGIGLTTDSPDFSLGLDVPLTFQGL
ncbi:MAG TPA: transporter [Burkholderiaceae bacterium]